MSKTATLDAPAENAETTEATGNMSGGELFSHFRKLGTESAQEPESNLEEEPVTTEDSADEQPVNETVEATEDTPDSESPSGESPDGEETEESTDKTFSQEELNEIVQRRLDRLKQQTQSEKEELEKRLEALEGKSPVPNDIHAINSIEELDSRLEQAQSAIQVVSEALTKEPSDYDDKGNAVYKIDGGEYSKDDLLAVQDGAFSVVKDTPGRKQLLQVRSQVDQALTQQHSFFTDENHKDYDTAQRVMETVEYKALEMASPHAKEMVVRYLESEYYRADQKAKAEIKKKAKGSKPPEGKVAKAASDTGTASAPLSPEAKTTAKRKNLIKSGNLRGRKLDEYFKK